MAEHGRRRRARYDDDAVELRYFGDEQETRCRGRNVVERCLGQLKQSRDIAM
ncbi:hypothetical protein [Microbacterium sp. P03]|uniref:hypothetical protein n=1 Tax=Microbacterium sp. P03 TaxID=3366946 RepID=UPI003744C693